VRYVPPEPTARLGLQRYAPPILRRHLARAVLRVAALITGDLAAFGTLRALHRLLESWPPLDRLMPAGYLDGWQYALALALGLSVTGNYGPGDLRRDPTRLWWGCALATALPLWAPLWQRGLGLTALQFSVTTSVVWLALVLMRRGLDTLDAQVVKRTPASLRTLLIGSPDSCAEAGALPAFSARAAHRVIGFVDTGTPTHAPNALGSLAALPALIQQHRIESVVICGRLADPELHDVVDQALTAGCTLLSIPHIFALPGVQPRIGWDRGQPFVELSAQTLKAWQFALKRVIDVIGSVVGLVLLAPLLAALACAIRFESPGPALFRQRRTGLGGRPFLILKFRTMRADADALKASLTPLSASADPRIFKMANDPRVSPLGRFLRRWALDELPQLWNVLAGQMSLVGPRPFVETPLDCYEAHHFRRLGAKPGITGLWQIRRDSDTVDFEQIMALDAEYIREWSPLLDLKILLLTVPALIRGRGVV
jgi:exopolysaccharide biosynthesis polyprenyl glycosylphosphotransferase